MPEARELADTGREQTGEAVSGDREVSKAFQLSDHRGEGAGDVQVGQIEREDHMHGRVAADAIPCAKRCMVGRVPAGEKRL